MGRNDDIVDTIGIEVAARALVEADKSEVDAIEDEAGRAVATVLRRGSSSGGKADVSAIATTMGVALSTSPAANAR
jgi:hypothetical protein